MTGLKAIASGVCAAHRITLDALLGKAQTTRWFQRAHLWPARREFVRRALDTGLWSSADVARFMQRDPGTIRALKKAAMRDGECATGGE